MRIFLTGGTGYIGSAVLDALVRGGHHVAALVRHREKATAIAARGAHPVLGDLSQPAGYVAAAEAADGVIHTAIDMPRAHAVDALAIDALLPAGRAASRPGRFFIYTSGIWVLGPAPAPVDEASPINPIEQSAWRAPHEQRVLEASAWGTRTVVVRPGIVYGGSRGIVGDLFRDAANGLVRVIGSGDNHWPLVYDRDLGELYLRLATNGSATGIYHANDECDERVNDLVSAIAGHVPIHPSVRKVPLPEARQKLGAYADALALDQIVRCPRARALGWSPSLHAVSRNAARLFEEWRRGREAA
ncbi:MAG TPA: NAD-dependent epimerase/dehydratase family protein [Vicinamibacterales bacterium]|nr:NAD-dependent epimerase/dehydratase family protein [Vicinamibacterales bacterium]